MESDRHPLISLGNFLKNTSESHVPFSITHNAFFAAFPV